jgi:hypothetical protein
MVTSTSSSPTQKLPTLLRCCRWLFNWRTIRRVLIGLAVLFTLLALLWTEENWRGKHAWESYQRELEAKGEKLDLASFVPPRVPDDQNFAMTPFLAPLFDFNPEPRKPGESRWRDTNAFNRTMEFARDIRLPDSARGWVQLHPTDLPASARDLEAGKNAPPAEKTSLTQAQAAAQVLRFLDRLNPVLDEVRQACQRPYSRFNLQYDSDDPWGILLPHLAVLKKLGGIFQLRASAELALGQSGPALADTEMTLYLADAMKNEPFLISRLVRIALLKTALQPVWEGLAGSQWSEAQLVELEQRLGRIDLLTEYGNAIRAERAFSNVGIEQMRAGRIRPGESPVPTQFAPAGWFYQNELVIDRVYQDLALPLIEGAAQRAYPAKSAGDEAIEKVLGTGFPPYHIMARLLFPAINSCAVQFAAGQTSLNEAVIGCALERYRLIHGQFPETLEALSPQFLDKIPPDIITGQSLKYQRTDAGRFILYSVGWDEKDHGGTIAMNKGKTAGAKLAEGDWVWEYPAK